MTCENKTKKLSRSNDQDKHHFHLYQTFILIFFRTRSLVILKLGMKLHSSTDRIMCNVESLGPRKSLHSVT